MAFSGRARYGNARPAGGWTWKRLLNGAMKMVPTEDTSFLEDLRASATEAKKDGVNIQPIAPIVSDLVEKIAPLEIGAADVDIRDVTQKNMQLIDVYMSAPQYSGSTWSELPIYRTSSAMLSDDDMTRLRLMGRMSEPMRRQWGPIKDAPAPEQIQLGKRARLDEEE